MTFFRPALPFLAITLALSACDTPLDMDLRGAFGNAPSTADAARAPVPPRPEPDERGIISYPGYQVAVAKRGDTLGKLARRIGTDPQELARYNGIQTGDPLRQGEIVALPRRVTEPEGGPIRPASDVDIAALADGAIRRADAETIETSALEPAPHTGAEPLRHKVERGETAYSIARLYEVPLRSLAEWNGLGADFTVREGQFLLVPMADRAAASGAPLDATTPRTVEPPGAGSSTPAPPSATRPLPRQDQPSTAEIRRNAEDPSAAPDLSSEQTASAPGRMGFPVQGDIVRDYAKGRNDGIDIAASPGSPVTAAADGVVAAITEDTNGSPIIVIKHPDNLLTVYSNVGGVTVAKGDSVTRGAKLAEARSDGPGAVHFEVREGFESVDPTPYLR